MENTVWTFFFKLVWWSVDNNPLNIVQNAEASRQFFFPWRTVKMFIFIRKNCLWGFLYKTATIFLPRRIRAKPN